MSVISQNIENLSPKKRALFEMLLKERSKTGASRQQIKPRLTSGPLPLTLAQERMWLLDQMETGSAQYNNAASIRFSGPLDITALEQSLGQIIKRHEILRTTFALVGAQPQQEISPVTPYSLPFRDVSTLPEDKREAEIARFSTEEAMRPFDLARGPLMRVTLLKASDEQYVIFLTMHHIVTDGLSVAVLIREITALYAAYIEGVSSSPLPDLPVQYADYAVWQRQWLESEAAEEQLQYWKRQLEGAPEVLLLPTDRPRPAVQSFNGATYSFTLTKSLAEELKALSRSNEATIFMTLLATFQLLLARYSQQQDILTGTLVNNRNRAELENLAGYFINTLVLRTDLSGDPTFSELLSRVRDNALQAYAQQDLPFERLVEKMELKRDVSRSQLFQVMFNLINLSLPAMKFGGLEFSDVLMSRTEVENGSAKFDLSLEIEDAGNDLKCWLVYNTDLFDEDTIVRMAAHFRGLLESIVADPQQHVSDLPLLTAGERRHLVEGWTSVEDDFQLDRCFHELFEAQAALTPAAVALVHETGEMSYRELNERANRAAHALADRGVGPETVVGLFVHRDQDFLTAVLSVFKAGGAYLPLDPSYPSRRLQQVLNQSRCSFIVVADDLAPQLASAMEELPPEESPFVLSFGEMQDQALPSENLPVRSVPGNLAYVIYTSGSTGVPKGAMVEQRGMLNHLFVKIEDLQLTGADVVGQSASQFFDISVWQFLAALLVGGRVQIINDDVTHDPWQLLEEIERCGVTISETVPSMLRAMLSELELTGGLGLDLSSLRWMIATGEALPPDLCRRWLNLYAQIPLLNAYGPTECSDDVTHHVVERAPGEEVSLMPIGQAVRNIRLYILDHRLRLVPIGIGGELCVGGVGVGRGYLHDPEHTARAFVPHPFSAESGARLYSTGDLARFLPDGNIEYLGRLDHQVKIRGFRIELGEIEAVLGGHSEIREAVVLAREDVPGDQRLVAYVVAGSDSAPSTGELRDYVKERLPEYMVPSAVVVLETMPLTVNGKVDRQALPAPEASDNQETYGSLVAPRTPVEEVLAGIWSEALAVKRVGIKDNFFELGGHSLLVVQIISRVREAFSVELSLREMFENPTVAGLAESIERAIRGEHGAPVPPIKPVTREKALPLSFAQQRLWFMDQFSPGNFTFNIPAALNLEGNLDVAVLERSLNEIIQRHESLRTIFESVDGEPVQIIKATSPLTLTVTDLRSLPEHERDAQAQRLVIDEGQRLFDLAQGPLLRAGLLRLDEERFILLFTMHHIITDGWSAGVLLRELTTLYEAFSREQPSPLPALPVQYADYAVWQQNWLQGEVLDKHLDYWRDQLDKAPMLLELPTDRPRPAVQAYRGKRFVVNLPEELSAKMRELSRREGVTLFMLLLAAFKVLLARYTGQTDVLVGVPVANRQRPELENLIGLFANLLVLRTEVASDLTFKQLLQRVREVALGAYMHQGMPFEKLVAALNLERSLSYNPLVQVVLALHNAPLGNLAIEGLKFSVPVDHTGAARLDLILDLVDRESGISGALEYDRDLFDEGTVVRLMDSYQRLLESIVAHPEQSISELELLTEVEREKLLVQWNTVALSDDPLPSQCLHQLFEAQVERTPQAIALTFEDKHLTYDQLNRRANKIAHHLQSLGIGPEARVGILMERSAEMVVAILSILKAGGGYVPLDPTYPSERLTFMLEDARVPVLLTSCKQSLENLRLPQEVRVVCLESDWKIISQESEGNPAQRVTAENLAYNIYTSGSTGRPKGVQVNHGSAVALFAATRHLFEFDERDTWTVFHSHAFDLSVWEIWGCLLHGGRLVIVPLAVAQSPESFYRLLCAEQVTVLNQTPSAIRQLIQIRETGIEAGPLALRLIICGGEALPRELAAPLLQWGVPTWNFYGPTEATVWTTVHSLENPDAEPGLVSIGRPLARMQAYILDQRMQPVPSGVAGELHLGGVGLARGYLNSHELTAERFIPHPFSTEAGARLYRTGDMARYLPDGEIEFLGRLDHQVKIRGFRIELGEIEAVLNAHAQVRETAVLSREDAPGDKRLVAYVVAQQDEAPPASQELRGYLKEKLPDYMIPSTFMLLDEMPLTQNGKVNRKALPAPEESTAAWDGRFVGTRNPVEDVLVSIWSEVLHLARVGVDDNFFDLGGHSLLATRLISHVRDAFQVEISLRTLFEQPTVAGLAEYIEAALKSEETSDATPLLRVPRETDLPLSFAQKRLWLEDQLQPGRAGQNTPILLRYDQPLNTVWLEQCLNEVVARHEVLRTIIFEKDGQPVQHIQSQLTVSLPVIDLRETPQQLRTSQALELAHAEGVKPFDLSRGPLLRAKVLQLGGEEYWLLLLMHHIIIDPWSLSVLLRELTALYVERATGERALLPDLEVQYADYAVWQQRWLESETAQHHLAYWKQQLGGSLMPLELPTDHPRTEVRGNPGASLPLEFTERLSDELRVLSRREGVTLFMTLLAAFNALLHRYTDQDEILLITPTASRPRRQLENLVGYFANLVLLRSDLKGNPTWREMLRRARETVIDAYTHDALPVEIVLDALREEHKVNVDELMRVSFGLLSSPSHELDGIGPVPQPLFVEVGEADYDISLRLWEQNERLVGQLVYKTNLFATESMKRMAAEYQSLLEAMLVQPEQTLSDLLPVAQLTV